MYNYTILLYKYAKLTARESYICTQLFFRTKIREIFKGWLNRWISASMQCLVSRNEGHTILVMKEEDKWRFRFLDMGEIIILTKEGSPLQLPQGGGIGSRRKDSFEELKGEKVLESLSTKLILQPMKCPFM